MRANTHTHVTHTQTHTRERAHTHTNTHTQRGKEKTGYSVAGEGVTKRAASGPFGTFCHHTVTKRARVTKRAGSASNLTRFVTRGQNMPQWQYVPQRWSLCQSCVRNWSWCGSESGMSGCGVSLVTLSVLCQKLELVRQ